MWDILLLLLLLLNASKWSSVKSSEAHHELSKVEYIYIYMFEFTFYSLVQTVSPTYIHPYTPRYKHKLNRP